MKRIAVGALWLASFWYLGSTLAALLGVADVVGPLLGVIASAVVVLDPLHMVWKLGPASAD